MSKYVLFLSILICFLVYFYSKYNSTKNLLIAEEKIKKMKKENVVIESIKKWIPKLTSKSYKGSSGKVGVIGGSEIYTGAPYFSAISALKTGADIAHIFCSESSANIIKSFSGDIIVHPTFITEKEKLNKDIKKIEITKKVTNWFGSIHTLVIGPGLGRDPFVFECCLDIIEEAKKSQLPIIIDGDALFLLATKIEIIKGYEDKVFLTPNLMEYRRLANKVLNGIDPTQETNPKQDFDITPQQLSEKLGGVTIIAKGQNDTVVSGKKTLTVDIIGSNRRCGGQGDIMTGTLATFISWAKLSGTFDEERKAEACYAASSLLRYSNGLAFKKKGRGMITTDILKRVPDSFTELFEN